MDDISFDGLETLNHGEFYGSPFNAKAARLAQEKNLAAIGSSDAHDIHFIGMAYTEFPGYSGEHLRRSIQEKSCVAQAQRGWSVKEVLHHLKVAGPILSRYSKLPAVSK